MPSKPAVRNLADVCDLAPAADDFRTAVLRGLSRPQKEIPAKFLYDEIGSRLFEAICRLDEYYPTRTEMAILAAAAADIAGHLPAGATVIELGSGASEKIRLLLDALVTPRAYVPVDLARDPLARAAALIAQAYPHITVTPVCADFIAGLTLPGGLPDGSRVAFFPGSTIGNFHPEEAVCLLADIRAGIGAGGYLLIGVDLKKDPLLLRRAYDDAAGVTAAFNSNLLTRINRELGATFAPTRFRHRADYNARAGRIEMHLVSTIEHSVRVDGETFRFRCGESIHTENSYKFAVREFQALAARAGLATVAAWTDAHQLFSVQLFRALR